MNILIVTIKEWNIKKAVKLKQAVKEVHNINIITDKSEFNYERVRGLNPDYIFFPHWSWIIPEKIFKNYKCVVFHMTDLPYGRGGSPLQNLIERGFTETKISAIKVVEKLDAGDIYLKESLSLHGTAEEIFIRAAKIIFNKMIPQFLEKEIMGIEQEGRIVNFFRRNKDDSMLKESFDLEKIYDYIRMLDGEGYPKAFIMFGGYRLEFSRASLKNGKIIADVEIISGGEVDNE